MDLKNELHGRELRGPLLIHEWRVDCARVFNHFWFMDANLKGTPKTMNAKTATGCGARQR
jgi:hypothetical protein